MLNTLEACPGKDCCRYDCVLDVAERRSHKTRFALLTAAVVEKLLRRCRCRHRV